MNTETLQLIESLGDDALLAFIFHTVVAYLPVYALITMVYFAGRALLPGVKKEIDRPG